MNGPEKEAYINGLFSSIAPRYDLLNTVISLARHKAWRRFAVSKSGLKPGDAALDVCCGTGDFALELSEITGQTGSVTGADFLEPMLSIAKRKASRAHKDWVSFVEANACHLPFEDDCYNCVTVGFGLRNTVHPGKAISEMVRVAKPGGCVISLEITGVTAPFFKTIWDIYFDIIMPRLARIFSAKGEAYDYLPGSVKAFLSSKELADEFRRYGLRDVAIYSPMFGAVSVHVGKKQEH